MNLFDYLIDQSRKPKGFVGKIMLKVMNNDHLRSLSIFWSLFIGVGALCGSIMMFMEPSGKIWDMYMMLPYFQKLPWADVFFQNFIFPGIALLLANGITNFVSFFLLYTKHRYAALSVMFCGIILMLWITVQFVIFTFNFMSTLYFVFGMLQFMTGFGYWKMEREAIERMKQIEQDNPFAEKTDYGFIKTRLSPCGLHCGKCFAYAEGDICRVSRELKANLGDFDVYAKRFVDLLDEPLFQHYSEFAEMLNYFSSGKCKGCRREVKCALFKGCNVRACSERKGVDFCFQCSAFPCNNTGFDEHLQKRWEMINIKMKACGVEAYYNEIKDKPRY
jgi:hypothetical protein